MRYLFLLVQFLLFYFTSAMSEVVNPISYRDFGQYSAYGSSFNGNPYNSVPFINNVQSAKNQSFPRNISSLTNFSNSPFNKNSIMPVYGSDEYDNRTLMGEEQELWNENIDTEDNATVNMNNEGLLYEDLHYSLEELKRYFNIIGYNLYNLLKKNSYVSNRDKLKIDEYYSINVDLLDTLNRIINNQNYPSLYLKHTGTMEANDQSNLEDGDNYFEDDVPIIPVTLETSDDETTEFDEDYSDEEGATDINNEEDEEDIDDEDEENQVNVDNEEGTGAVNVTNGEKAEVNVDNEDEAGALNVNNEEEDVDDEYEEDLEIDVNSDDEAEAVTNEEDEEVDVDNEEGMNTLEDDDDIFSGNASSIASSGDDSDGELIGGVIGGLVGGAALGVLGSSLFGEEIASDAQTAINSEDYVSYDEDDTVNDNDESLDAASYEEDASNWSDDETLTQDDGIVPEESVENTDQAQSTNNNTEIQDQGSTEQADSVIEEEAVINQDEAEDIAEAQNQDDTLIENIDNEKSVITQEDAAKTEMSGVINTVTQELPLQSENVEMTTQEFINSSNKEIIFKELREPKYLNQSDPIFHENGTSIFVEQIEQNEPVKQIMIYEDGKIHAKDF